MKTILAALIAALMTGCAATPRHLELIALWEARDRAACKRNIFCTWAPSSDETEAQLRAISARSLPGRSSD